MRKRDLARALAEEVRYRMWVEHRLYVAENALEDEHDARWTLQTHADLNCGCRKRHWRYITPDPRARVEEVSGNKVTSPSKPV